MVSLTWKVPPNAASGLTVVSRSRGSRRSSMLTLTWAPSAAARRVRSPPPARMRAASTAGPTPLSTRRPRSDGSRRRSSPRRPGEIAVTSALVRRSAPASRAARSSSAVTRPMPPTGTSQSPGAAADHVVEEAAVLAQARLVAAGEGADEPVGQRDAPREVAPQRGAQQFAERALDDVVPELVVVQARPQRRAARRAARSSSGRSATRAGRAARRTRRTAPPRRGRRSCGRTRSRWPRHPRCRPGCRARDRADRACRTSSGAGAGRCAGRGRR